ncbi:MAG TPA: FAD:protein FMN transferase [Flavitalea sp.]|nr:FAD:protein FMN transferase [Flavitalea sp.]
MLYFFSPVQEIKTVHFTGQAQGTTWSVTYYHTDTSVSQNKIDSIFSSIDSSLSVYKPYSTISAFNKSTRGIKLDVHLKNIVRTSLEVTRETKGLSDITVAPLIEAWGFLAKQSSKIPDDHQLHQILKCVGIKNIRLKGDSLIKLKPCVKIDVNGIAQGYTVDVIASYLETEGINNYVVEVGGEVCVKGRKQPGNKPFKIGIESPSGDDFSALPMQRIVILNHGAVTTSGNYRKFHESKGKKYSHIINPHTGKSAGNGMISATVYAKNATTADAYDNALMLMGVKKALKFIEARPDMAAFIIYKTKNGAIADTASSRFRHFIQ